MGDHSRPRPGSIVTYFDPEPGDGGPFHRGIACGTTIPDPYTGHVWALLTSVGPAGADAGTLVDETLIVDVAPPVDGSDTSSSPHDPIALLCAALDTAIGELDELDVRGHRAWPRARRIVAALLDTIAPAREALLAPLDNEPDSRVEPTIGHLDRAVTHLDAGDVEAGRAALGAAHAALTVPLTTRPTRPAR